MVEEALHRLVCVAAQALVALEAVLLDLAAAVEDSEVDFLAEVVQ